MTVRSLFPLLLVAMLAGCASPDPMRTVRPMLDAGDLDGAIAHLEAGLARNPERSQYRVALLRVRETAALTALLDAENAFAAGDDVGADAALERAAGLAPQLPALATTRQQFERRRAAQRLAADAQSRRAAGDVRAARSLAAEALASDPTNRRASTLLQDLQREADEAAQRERSELSLLDGQTVTLEFRDAPVRQVFEALSRSAGLSFVFDQDVKREAKVTLMLQSARVSEALRVIGAAQRLAFRPIGERAVLVYPATAAKRNEHRELMVRTFHLSNASAKEMAAMLRSVLKARDVTPDDKLNVVVMRDSPETVRVAERLVAAHDIADAEVMLDVEVLEVSRSQLTKLGLEASRSIGLGLPGDTGQVVLGASGVRSFVANPALILNLRQRENFTDLLANPRIRVKNRSKARIHIGEKVPVITTTSTANVGVSSSVSYLDVGLKLDVEPTIHLDREVSIGLKLEVSNIIETVTVGSTGGGSTIAYRLGTRNTETNLRLQDGQTQVLAGLIQNDQRRTRAKIPGLAALPLIGRLFSSDDGDGSIDSKTEVVLLITPRILRTLDVPSPDRARFFAGTAGEAGAAPLVIDAAQVQAEIDAVGVEPSAPDAGAVDDASATGAGAPAQLPDAGQGLSEPGLATPGPAVPPVPGAVDPGNRQQ